MCAMICSMLQNFLRSEIRLVSKHSDYGGITTQNTQKDKDKDCVIQDYIDT